MICGSLAGRARLGAVSAPAAAHLRRGGQPPIPSLGTGARAHPSRRGKAADVAAALLEPLAGPAWAEVIPADLLHEFLVAVDDPHATLHVRFGGEALAAFARPACCGRNDTKAAWIGSRSPGLGL